MAGFAAGLAQGFGNFGDDLAADRVRREESQIRQLTFLRQQQLDQAKQVGDVIKSYSDAIETLPEDQVSVRTDLFMRQLEQITGQKIDPAVMKTMKADPQATAQGLTQLYGDKPFAPKALGGVLSNINAFTGVFDALQRRNQSMQAAADFGMGTGGAATGGTPAAGQAAAGAAGPGAMSPLEAIDAQIAQIGQAAQRLSATGNLDKQRTSFLEKRLGILQQQRDQLLTGDTEAQKNRAAFIPPAMAAQLGLPINTTMGQLGQGGAQSAPIAPQAAQGTPMQPTAGVGFTGNPMIDAVMHTESRGNPAAVSGVGAAGTMQTMPSTLTNPGFGVTPAKDNSAAEKQRVGIDYWNAMNQKYGDPALAAVAYNMGPDKTDKWIQAGADFRKLPKETQDYVGQVMLRNGINATGRAQKPVAEQAPASRSLVPPTEAQLAQNRVIAEGAGKAFNDMRTANMQAVKGEAQVKTLGSLLEQAGRTGTGASTMLGLRKIAQAAGFTVDPSANYAEAARGLAVHMIGQARTAAGGVGSTSNYEDALYQQGVMNIDKLPGANKILMAAAVKDFQRTQQIYKEVAKYVAKNGYDDVGVNELVQKYTEEHPIFSAADAKALMGGKSMAEKPTTAPIPKGWGVEVMK